VRRATLVQVRLLLLVLGIGVGVAQTLLAWDRGAAPTEVLAPALYIPVFGAAIFFGVVGGLAAAALSSTLYGLVLIDQSGVLGTRLFVGMLVNRTTTYVLYGLVVAIGARFLEGKLHKLELYDHIDDETDLYNSSFFLDDTAMELSRAGRYSSIFSVAEVRLADDLFARSSRSRRRHTRRDMAKLLRTAIRTVDRPSRVRDEDGDRFLVILPETDRQGSDILAERLGTAARRYLADQGVEANGSLAVRALAFPEDTEALNELRSTVAVADARRRVLAAPSPGTSE